MDRRECLGWTGAAVLWTVAGGVPRSGFLGEAKAAAGGFSFVQISDSHIGFAKPPNLDAPGTFAAAIALVAARKGDAAMMVHTGDVSHLSKPGQFDTAEQLMRPAGLELHAVPGEHDVLENGGAAFFARFTKGAARGYYSFDQGGVHFVALNNVQDLKPGGLGRLGTEQLDWLRADLTGRSASTPIVVLAHIPLWTVYAPWGWGTDDSEQALALLRRFGSVTVLNGHIHQVMQKVEGQVAFHTARSTAFPQPAPGTAASPGPIKDFPAGRLREVLGIATAREVRRRAPLAITDVALG